MAGIATDYAPPRDIMDEVREVLQTVRDAMLRDDHGNIREVGWNITTLNCARPRVHALLAKLEAGRG